MSGRLKFLLAILAVGAGLSFWYTMNFAISGSEDSKTTANALNALAQEPSCSDQDGDGLCDYDETYWNTDFKNPDTDGDGFKDGEEVLSGHDPAKKGPDDFLNNKQNLTERAGNLLLGGIATGDLNPNSTNYKASVDALIDEIFMQYDANVATDLDSIMIASSSRDALVSYSFKMAQILGPMFTEISANHDALLKTAPGVQLSDIATFKKTKPELFSAFVAAANAEVGAFSDRVQMVKNMRVPSQMESFHRALVQYLRGTQQRYRALATIDKDPLLGIISLQVLNTLTSVTPLDLVTSFQNQAADAINSK